MHQCLNQRLSTGVSSKTLHRSIMQHYNAVCFDRAGYSPSLPMCVCVCVYVCVFVYVCVCACVCVCVCVCGVRV